MYLSSESLNELFSALSERFSKLCILVDCYTPLAVRMSKYKNPVKDVGVSELYGVQDPKSLEYNECLTFVKEHSITPSSLINELKGFEKKIFETLYAGKISKKLYKMYEYEKQ